MVAAQVSRVAIEVVGAEPTSLSTTRVEQQVGADARAAGSQDALVSRVSVEVVGAEPASMATTRVEQQVGADARAAGSQDARVSRVSVEVVGGNPPAASTTRVEQQVGASARTANAQVVRVSRVAVEVVAPQTSAGLVVPLPLNTDSEFFLYNWADALDMRTSYLTDARTSPATGAESRRGLVLKPFRSMEVRWLLTNVNELDRFEVFLRRITDQRFQMPIYQDQIELASAYVSADTTLNFATDKGRFFPGARVAIVQLDYCSQVTGVSFHLIDTLTNASISLQSALGVDVAAGSLVFPVMDCEVTLDPGSEYRTSRVPVVKLEVSEVKGQSTLPPVKSDNPTGATIFDGRPVFVLEPNWAKPVNRGRRRFGKRSSQGRADIVFAGATRSSATSAFALSGDRDYIWQAVEFFDTRRGRLRAFWLVDQDQIWNVAEVDVTGNFVSVSELGDYDDFKEEFGHVGIIMNDGTVYVREVVTHQNVLTVFRMTVDPPLPAGLDVNDISRVARARLSRYSSDEQKERWRHTNYGEIDVGFLELLDENNYPST